MGDFVLGPIKIIDNGDGIYRFPLKGAKKTQDEVVDLQGKKVTPTGAQALKVLRELGVSTLQGLRLSPASLYLEMMEQARGFASQGDTLQTQDRLLKARLAAAEAKLRFNEERAAAILKSSLEKELHVIADRARKHADAGEVLALHDTLNAGREILSRLAVPLDEAKGKGYSFTPELIEQLEQKGYTQALPIFWKKVEAASQAGNVPRVHEAVAKLREYAKRGRTNLTPDEETRLAELERKTYEISVENNLTEAAAFALQGDRERTGYYIAQAKDAALIAKLPLNSQQKRRIVRMEHLALCNAPSFLLKKAEEKADAGEVEEVRALIQKAKDARAQTGYPLSQAETIRAEAAERKALQLSVDVLLGQAAGLIPQVKRNGNLQGIRQLITRARLNAALANITLSAAQETSVQSLFTRAYRAAVDWRFAQAASSAALGKVDDTTVPLNAGRELAKQGGVNFDEAAAAELIQTALTKGLELEFTAAEKFAKAGDAENAQFHLETARDFSVRLGKKFDKLRAEKILKLLPTK